MPKVFFSTNLKREKEYLFSLLREKKWFESEGFPVFLPKGKAEIKKQLGKADRLLRDKIIKIKKNWEEIEKEFFSAVEKLSNAKVLPKYICYVTKFGPEGKYTRPNIIFLRLRTKRDFLLANETVAHELVHLIFADFFISKKLHYREIESFVDEIIIKRLKSLLPNYKKQNFGCPLKKS